MTHDYTGVPILLIRRPDGSLGASLNVCRHRGARVALSQKYQASILPSWTNSLTPLLLIASPDTGGTGTFHFIVGPGESVPGQESLEACVRCKAIEANPHNREYDLALQQALEDLLQGRAAIQGTTQPITTGHRRPGASTHYWRH